MAVHRDYSRPPTAQRSESWDDDRTPPNIGDPETYRAVRDLKKQAKENSEQIGGITLELELVKKEVSGIKSTMGDVDTKLDRFAENHAKLTGQLDIIIGDRRTVSVTQTKLIATETATSATKETLAERVLEIESEARKFKHRVWGKIVAGVFSGGVLVALIALIGERC